MELKKVNSRYYGHQWWHPFTWKDNIKCFFRGLKQDRIRRIYGISNIDCWDMDSYMMTVLHNGLKIYRKDTIGHPANLTENEWNRVLDHMIHLTEVCLQEDDPAAVEAFDMYWKSRNDKEGDSFLRDEWMRKTKEFEEYKQECSELLLDYLKEWGHHLWW